MEISIKFDLRNRWHIEIDNFLRKLFTFKGESTLVIEGESTFCEGNRPFPVLINPAAVRQVRYELAIYNLGEKRETLEKITDSRFRFRALP